jgi:hypothetical protein
MRRTYKRKTERADVAPDKFPRIVKLENMAVRGATWDFGIPFGSVRRYYNETSEEGIRGISQNATFITGYSKRRKVSSSSRLYVWVNCEA